MLRLCWAICWARVLDVSYTRAETSLPLARRRVSYTLLIRLPEKAVLGNRMESANFAFLMKEDERLVLLGGLAERYFRTDPSTAILKLRQFAELVAKLIAAHHALYRDEPETFEEILRRLSYE